LFFKEVVGNGGRGDGRGGGRRSRRSALSLEWDYFLVRRGESDERPLPYKG